MARLTLLSQLRTNTIYFCKRCSEMTGSGTGLCIRRPSSFGFLSLLILLCITANALFGQDRKAVLQRAVDELRQRHPDAAIALLEPLITSQPDDYKVLTLMGMALSANGKNGNAI